MVIKFYKCSEKYTIKKNLVIFGSPLVSLDIKAEGTSTGPIDSTEHRKKVRCCLSLSELSNYFDSRKKRNLLLEETSVSSQNKLNT